MTLSVINLTVSNGEQRLFSPVTFTVKQGDIFTLMGPSGCGKSTLLSAIAGHLSYEFSCQGHVTLNDIDVMNLQPNLRKIGLLFQDDLLFPHFTVAENLMFGLPKHYRGKLREQRIADTLTAIGLSELTHKMPNEISGGQRARISVMRMLLSEPDAVLLDEPFSKLDKALRNEFRLFVFEQIRSRNIPAIMVTHDDADIPKNGQVLQWPWTPQLQEQVTC
ncbi:ATP-binding cassette domain-containing protein [Photobacterium nomapromontoriensis]|uniref:ATP-binding cassette domain-containing protein n=1 Tax=Photobacterium nomapromontoriensis TaxID=2910237 RepID=UPI003D0EEB8C